MATLDRRDVLRGRACVQLASCVLLFACGSDAPRGDAGSSSSSPVLPPPQMLPVAGTSAPMSTATPMLQAGAGGAGAAGQGQGVAGAAGLGGTGGAIAGAGGAGGMMTAGTGGAGDAGSMSSPPQTCAAPPADAPPIAVEALNIVNAERLAAGAGCMQLVPELIASAQAHCDYVAMHDGDPSCDGGGHGETMGCAGFTGSTVQAREIAAGYPQRLAYTEVFLSYGDDPMRAVPGWIDTVWHRIPLLDPWAVDMGWGGATGCDVIDIGHGMSSMPDDTVAVYPYDGQVDVPPAFSGLEAPAPPPPAGGWPSSYPINVYARDIQVTEHVLTKDGDAAPLPHLWLDTDSPEVSSGLKGYFRNTVFMYGAPFELSTKYRVKIVGTYAGGALNVEWTFTTGARRPFGT